MQLVYAYYHLILKLDYILIERVGYYPVKLLQDCVIVYRQMGQINPIDVRPL